MHIPQALSLDQNNVTLCLTKLWAQSRWMVGSDIGDINSPTHAGSRSTRVDPKLFGKPSDLSGDRRECRHVEWVFRNWFGFLYDTADGGWTKQRMHLEHLGKRFPDRRETDKALYMSLAMVCKNEAIDVVNTVTHKRGFESWRKLSKEYGATTGTSLHEYTNLLEYDFGTTDRFKERLLKWGNQNVDFQNATGEVFSDRLKMCNCVVKITSTNQNELASSESRRLWSSSSCIDELPGSWGW